MQKRSTGGGGQKKQPAALVSLQKFSTSGRYEPRGALARKPDAKPSSLPDTNINPEMTFKINSTIDLKYNLQKDLQGEVRKREEGQLVKVFHRMDLNNDNRVCVDDLEGTLRSLSPAVRREEVESMLWEVDDDTKGYLTAADFKASYYRIRASKEADEPRSWFRLVEFMMIDEDGDGTIAFDEAAKMFRNRYGKDSVESVQTMFKRRAEPLPGDDGAIRFREMTYAEFLTSMATLVK